MTDKDLQRFWSKVRKSDVGCWMWRFTRPTACYSRQPRATFTFDGRSHSAARVMWILTYGEISGDKLYVRHHCDNPECVRPDHLFLGTCSDNIQDAIRKGRIKRKRGRPSGSIGKVRLHIVKDLSDGMRQSDVARKHNVSRQYVSYVAALD